MNAVLTCFSSLSGNNVFFLLSFDNQLTGAIPDWMTNVTGCVNVCSNSGLTYPSVNGSFSNEMLNSGKSSWSIKGSNLECEWSVEGTKYPCKW